MLVSVLVLEPTQTEESLHWCPDGELPARQQAVRRLEQILLRLGFQRHPACERGLHRLVVAAEAAQSGASPDRARQYGLTETGLLALEGRAGERARQIDQALAKLTPEDRAVLGLLELPLVLDPAADV